MPLEAGIALLTLATYCGTLVAGMLLREQLGGLRHGIRRIEAWQRDTEYTSRAVGTLVQVQKLAEAGVSIGTDTVRGIHQGIASIPFGILEAIPATRETTRVVRAIHDQTSDVVYGAIGAVNRVLGQGLRRGLGAETPAPPPHHGFISDAEMVAFRHFVARRPEPAEFRSHYPDLTLVLPGEIAPQDYRADRSRYFAQLDEGGRISGGEFR